MGTSGSGHRPGGAGAVLAVGARVLAGPRLAAQGLLGDPSDSSSVFSTLDPVFSSFGALALVLCLGLALLAGSHYLNQTALWWRGIGRRSATFAGVATPSSTQILAYNGTTLLGTVSAAVTGQSVLSFAAPTITSIVVVPGDFDDWVGVDNITYTPAANVPEASTWAFSAATSCSFTSAWSTAGTGSCHSSASCGTSDGLAPAGNCAADSTKRRLSSGALSGADTPSPGRPAKALLILPSKASCVSTETYVPGSMVSTGFA